MDNKREPIIHHEDGESGQRQWVREREAELRPEPTVGDRKTAARIVEDINCELVSDKPVVLTEEWIDKIADALSAARGNRAELEAAAQKARAALRPEPTAGDTEAAEALWEGALEAGEVEIWNHNRENKHIDFIATFLSAAHGNRAELEAAAREGLNPVCNVCDRGREGRCHSGCGWFDLRQLLTPPLDEKER